MKHLPLMKGTVKTYSVSSDKLMKKKNIDCGAMNEDFLKNNEGFGIRLALTVETSVIIRSTQ